MENNKRMISIVMPIYNSEKYVSEAIESVCNQSYKNWELLIVNDGSTDQSSKIIDDYAKKDSRIKVFHRSNEGVSMARNYALDKCNGNYSTFIDSDDVYHPERLKKMMQIFVQNPDCDIVFTRHKEFRGELGVDDTRGTGSVKINNGNILHKIISDSRIHFVWNSMIKSEIAKKRDLHPYVLLRIFVIFVTVLFIVRKWRSWMRYYIFIEEIMRMQ